MLEKLFIRSPHRPLSADAANLRRLFWLRNTAILGQCGAVAAVWFLFDTPLPLAGTILPIAVLALFNLFVRYRYLSRDRITAQEFFANLLIDILALAVLLYFSGGATNPFTFLFLLPLTMAATLLRAPYVWTLGAMAAGLYTVLLFFYVPLPHGHSTGHDFSLHIAGMWFGFVLSAVIVGYFITGMRSALREQDSLLARAREQSLRDDRLVALGTLAAGAAHELGTPLSTASMLASELAQHADPEVADSAQQLRTQLKRCTQALAALSASAGDVRLSGGGRVKLDRFLNDLLIDFTDRRPQSRIRTQWHGTQPPPELIADRSLSLAITNILDNAADASPADIEWQADWTATQLRMYVRDRGPGLNEDARKLAGKTPYSNKPQGLGLGLFLSHSIVERLGGSVQISPREGGGLDTRIEIPIFCAMS